MPPHQLCWTSDSPSSALQSELQNRQLLACFLELSTSATGLGLGKGRLDSLVMDSREKRRRNEYFGL